MFGVTTPCVQAVTAELEADYDCLVFHATGIGGRSMENLADSGMLAGVIDVTTTEVADMLVGGVFPATEDRFGAFIRTGLPYVGSVGALDMVNFGPRDTVPEKFRGRKFVIHNPNVTLMRTTRDENRAIGDWIGERLNAMNGPVRFLLPEGGVSLLDAPGQAVPRSGGRQRAVRGDREDRAQTRPAAGRCACRRQHQRHAFRRRRWSTRSARSRRRCRSGRKMRHVVMRSGAA